MTLLRLGHLDLTDDSSALYRVQALSSEDGTDFGNPEPVEVALRSLLQDGSVVVSQGYDNREVTIAVTVSAGTSDGLALAESELFALIGTRTTLTWVPADRWGPPSVFDVLTSTLSFTFDDLSELRAERTYAIRLVCLPFARAENMVVSEAPAIIPGDGEFVAPVFTTISDASSLTGWSASSGTPLLTESNTAVTRLGFNGADLTYTPASPISASATPFLVIDYKVSANDPVVKVYVNGAQVSILSVAASPLMAGYLRILVDMPATFFSVRMSSSTPGTGSSLTITNIARASFPPGAGTSRQTFRTLPVKGSARTEGSLAIEHPTSSLGDVLAYTWPEDGSGYLPPLRTLRASGGTTTADSSLVSGGSDLLTTTVVYEVPSSLIPDGTYLLMARLKSPTTGLSTVESFADPYVGGNFVTGGPTGSAAVQFDVANAWQISTLGVYELPPLRMMNGSVRVGISLGFGAADLLIDEAWLFNVSIGSLTQVACGTGTPTPGQSSNRVWIEPASVESPLPTVLIGNAAEKADARFAGRRLAAWGPHEFRPPAMNVFTVTTNALNAETRLSHHPRAHTHVAPGMT